ncbi:Protein EI24 homolog [Durusdinium trenchii]|uniref:Protein EI24 homolog n=1 Tax=Durusdinium trenchii TaxID=1381693 RepID=A0ABP0IT52_9DINO
MLHQCIYFLARSETIRFRTLQCFVLNGVIFLGSILLFNFAVEPALNVLKRLVQEEEAWATDFIARSSTSCKVFWIYPIYCISFVLNTVMYQEIADSALGFLQRAPVKSTPHLERLIQETWRVLVNLVYLLEMYLVSLPQHAMLQYGLSFSAKVVEYFVPF